MDEQTEREVADGLRRGERAAWLRLYDAHAAQLWRHVARLAGPHADAVADIVQETFLAAARSAGQFDPSRGSLWVWLWGIARKQLAQHRRTLARHDEIARARAWWHDLNGQKSDWATGLADAPPEILAAKELGTLVRTTLAGLPEDYCLLLTAKYADDQPIEAIARTLDQSVPATHSKLARARRAFRRGFLRLTRSRDA